MHLHGKSSHVSLAASIDAAASETSQRTSKIITAVSERAQKIQSACIIDAKRSSNRRASVARSRFSEHGVLYIYIYIQRSMHDLDT